MVAAVVVMLDEGSDLPFEISRQVIVFEQYPVFQGLVPALDFALGLRMAWRTANVLDISLVEPLGEIGGDVGWPIIGEQTRLVADVGLGAA